MAGRVGWSSGGLWLGGFLQTLDISASRRRGGGSGSRPCLPWASSVRPRGATPACATAIVPTWAAASWRNKRDFPLKASNAGGDRSWQPRVRTVTWRRTRKSAFARGWRRFPPKCPRLGLQDDRGGPVRPVLRFSLQETVCCWSGEDRRAGCFYHQQRDQSCERGERGRRRPEHLRHDPHHAG